MKNLAIHAENLSKVYKLSSAFRLTEENPSSKPGSSNRKLLALDNVSFSVGLGETVGIIGANGAGKSTLLKILSGITRPSAGSVTINGHITGVIEVGMGFHNDLSGIDNIYFKGMLMGMSRKEVKERIADIIEYSEVGKYINMPLKYYSNGMYMRLAFSVVAHLPTDILLLDEVLLFGDSGFRKKCLAKIAEMSKQNRTVIIVTHHLTEITALCNRVLCLDEGKIIADGKPEEVIPAYAQKIHEGISHNAKGVGHCVEKQIIWEENNGPENELLQLISVKALRAGEPTSSFNINEPITINFRIKKKSPGSMVDLGFLLYDSTDTPVFASTTLFTETTAIPADDGVVSIDCQIPANLLNMGSFIVQPMLINRELNHVLRIAHGLVIKITLDEASAAAFQTRFPGPFRPKLEWKKSELK